MPRKTDLELGKAFNDMARSVLLEELKQSKWFRTAPKEAQAVDPVITLLGIEQHPVHVSRGIVSMGKQMKPFVVGETMVGGLKARIRVRLDLGAGGIVVDEESVSHGNQ